MKINSNRAKKGSVMSGTFSLHRLVRQTIDELPEVADPGILADRVFEQLLSEQYADAIRTMLRAYVRGVMAEDRAGYAVDEWDGSPELTEAIGQAERGEAVDLGDFSSHLEQESESPAPRRNRSSYREAMQAGAWRARLGERIHGASGWLLLRDCGPDDLKAAAAHRRELASANIRTAEDFEKLQELLITSGAATVGDLPDLVLQSAFAD